MPVVTTPASCANDEFRVANSEVPRINAQDQFAENFRCLCQGTKGVLDDCRPGCASGIIHYSIGPATAYETIYQNSALGVSQLAVRKPASLSPRASRPILLAAGASETTAISDKSPRHCRMWPALVVSWCPFRALIFRPNAQGESMTGSRSLSRSSKLDSISPFVRRHRPRVSC